MYSIHCMFLYHSAAREAMHAVLIMYRALDPRLQHFDMGYLMIDSCGRSMVSAFHHISWPLTLKSDVATLLFFKIDI